MNLAWRAVRSIALWGGVGAFGAAACGSASSADVFVADADAGASGAGGDAAGTNVANDGAVADDAAPGEADGGTSTDAAPGGTTTAIACGTASCSIPAQSCCATRTGQSTFNFSCMNAGTCPTNDAGALRPVALSCTSAANCNAGEVCCLTVTNATGSSACKPSGSCNGGGGNGVDTAVLCDPTNPSVGCPAGDPCSSKNIADWRLPNGFGTCGGRGR